MKNTVKKIISVLMCAAMLVGLLSTASFAAERWETISENDFESSLGDFSGALGTLDTEGYVNFYDAQGTELSFGYGVNVTSYDTVKISFRAKINSFSTGPTNFSGGDDRSTLGMKVNFGDKRVIISVEDGYIGACSSTATWASKNDAEIGNDWHTYDVIIDLTANTYVVQLDGTAVVNSTMQLGGNRGNGIYFFSNAASEAPADIDVEYVNVDSIDGEGNVLQSISKNDFKSSTGDFSGPLGTFKTTPSGYARLYNNSAEISFGNGLDVSVYDKVKISFRAKINSFTAGPGAFSGGADLATLGMKINFGNARVIWTVEDGYIGGTYNNSTWGKNVDVAIGNDWHAYDVIIDFVTRKYTVSLDGEVVFEGTIQEGNNRGYGVTFFSIGTEAAPMEAYLDDLSISYFVPEGVPEWESDAKLTYTNTLNGFTVSWPAATNATSYKVSVGGGAPVTVNGTSYTYAVDPDARSTTGYDVTVVAVGTGGESSVKLTANCNSKYDPASDQLDIKTLLTGTAGGNGESEYYIYRIPGMIVTEKDTLITYYEARTSSSDNGGMDIIMLRSTDGGESFEDPVVLVEGTDTGITVNNPVMIVDGETIHFLYCINYGVCNACVDAASASCEAHGGGGVYYCKSTNDGVSWTTPVNISDVTKPSDRYMIATGPGAGIVTKDGVLICPVWLVLKDSAGANPSDPLQQSPNDVSMLYSLDHGATWQMGEVLDKTTNGIGDPMEPIAVNLSDGRVMFNIRSWHGSRSYAISENGYSGFSPITLDSELIDPGCHAGLVSYDNGKAPYTLLFTNCENATVGHTGRTNIVLKGSTDDGETWDIRQVIDAGATGYSNVAVDSKGTIYVIYEVNVGYKENLARISYNAFNPEGESASKVETVPVTGIYVEEKADPVVSVNISWIDTVFSYTVDMKWDADEHKDVPVEGSGSWSEAPLTVTVTNYSNQSLKAFFTFRSAEVDGTKIISEITGTFSLSEFTLAEATAETGATKETTAFNVTGGEIYAENSADFSLGNITVTIFCVE